MKWTASSPVLKTRTFFIEHDEQAGFYLYVYENGRCIQDYLQDTLELAIEMGRQKFQIPRNVWKQVLDDRELD
jgi:hypothetical protein